MRAEEDDLASDKPPASPFSRSAPFSPPAPVIVVPCFLNTSILIRNHREDECSGSSCKPSRCNPHRSTSTAACHPCRADRWLGVTRNASADEIRNAYRKLAKQFASRSESGASRPEADASRRYPRLNEVLLSIPEKRARYDPRQSRQSASAPRYDVPCRTPRGAGLEIPSPKARISAISTSFRDVRARWPARGARGGPRAAAGRLRVFEPGPDPIIR